MTWKDRCFAAIDRAGLFESSGHRSRFRELLDCYADFPFFSPGMCKCMYMSAWDEEHFSILLETMMDLTLGHEKNAEEMRIRGIAIADENKEANSIDDYYMYQLSLAFLDNTPFDMGQVPPLSAGAAYVMKRSLMCAAIIDSIHADPDSSDQTL